MTSSDDRVSIWLVRPSHIRVVASIPTSWPEPSTVDPHKLLVFGKGWRAFRGH